jgi:hypothetical protein
MSSGQNDGAVATKIGTAPIWTWYERDGANWFSVLFVDGWKFEYIGQNSSVELFPGCTITGLCMAYPAPTDLDRWLTQGGVTIAEHTLEDLVHIAELEARTDAS